MFSWTVFAADVGVHRVARRPGDAIAKLLPPQQPLLRILLQE